MGCDPNQTRRVRTRGGFNSRSPDGLRHRYRVAYGRRTEFQFTQPGWAATLDLHISDAVLAVSIHAARMGCDFPVQGVAV
ncbi:Uncharacterised protein [Porphyromonas cangingivalis]|nr:Uncharacterised protein [Porphyromonas cangingivalis]